MTTTIIFPTIKSIEFINDTILFVHLNNDRLFVVPLDKFRMIKNLFREQKTDYEIIDNKYLSFLAIYNVFSVEELIGLS